MPRDELQLFSDYLMEAMQVAQAELAAAIHRLELLQLQEMNPVGLDLEAIEEACRWAERAAGAVEALNGLAWRLAALLLGESSVSVIH